MLERFETPRIADLHKDREHAKNVIDAYFAKYPQLEAKLADDMYQESSTPQDEYKYQEFYFVIQDLLDSKNPLPSYDEFMGLNEGALYVILDDAEQILQKESGKELGSQVAARMYTFAQIARK